MHKLTTKHIRLKHHNKAFTIVELLIVIIVLAVIATLVIISYSGITSKAGVASLQSDLTSNSKKLKLYQAQYGSYPTSLDANNCPTAPIASTDPNYCLTKSGPSAIASYSGTTNTFSLMIARDAISYAVTSSTGPFEVISVTNGSAIQNVNSLNCPTARTRVVDARDNHTYWVQKLAGGKCWMLTNLGYAGGGTNTYGDVKTLTASPAATYTVAGYYTPSSTNFTTEPNDPSSATNGTGQYGYLYNWCAAMGGQATAACANATTPDVNPNISICPSGWRLPTALSSGDFGTLISAINAGSVWLYQLNGEWSNGFYGTGSYGTYWSSTQQISYMAYALQYTTFPSHYSGGKVNGFAVRCVAN